MTTTVEKNKTAVHVGGTGDSPYRAAFQAVEAHTHTLQTVSCIVSRGPSHNLHSQTATVLMPFQYANFRLRVSVLFFCIHIYIPSSPRFGEKKKCATDLSLLRVVHPRPHAKQFGDRKKKKRQPVRTDMRRQIVQSSLNASTGTPETTRPTHAHTRQDKKQTRT